MRDGGDEPSPALPQDRHRIVTAVEACRRAATVDTRSAHGEGGALPSVASRASRGAVPR